MLPTSRTEHYTHGGGKQRNVILFLAANPMNASRVAFDDECAAIERELRMTDGRDDWDLRSKWAVTVDEMMRHFNELCPMIIHFSGHGRGGTVGRSSMSRRYVRTVGSDDDESSGGIYLRDEHGNPRIVTAHALKKMIRAAATSARVVLLNACHTLSQANTLCTVVDCVIGMAGAIHDDAARSFSVGFYRALGNGRSLGNSVEQAVATLAAKHLPDEHLPRCRTRKGVDAEQLFLNERIGV